MGLFKTRATASTVDELRTKVRERIGDTSETTVNQRYSNAFIDRSLEDEMRKITNRLNVHRSNSQTSATMTYTALGDTVSLADAVLPNQIFKVEDYTNTQDPVQIRHVGFHELEEWDNLATSPLVPQKYVWTIVGDAIAIRPRPGSALSIRIWYQAPTYTIVGATNTAMDQHPLPESVEELLVLGAAQRLLMVDNETPPLMVMSYQEMWKDLEDFASRYSGPHQTKRTRRVIS